MKIQRRMYALAGLLAASALALSGCTTSDPAPSGGGEGGGDDFYSDFVAPELTPEPGVDEMVDTSEFALDDPDGPITIGYADSSLANSWRVMAKAETEYGISTLGNATLVYTNADDSVPKQIADIDDMIAQRVDAIVLSAVDVNAMCPSIDKALAAGIPVIIQERAVNCENYTSFVSNNAPEVGTYHMEYIAQRLGGKGKIAIISGIAGAGHSVEMESFYASVLENYPDIEVVATEYAEYDPSKAQEVVSALLTAHPDIDAFASISGNITIGVFKAVQAAGKVDQMKAWTGDDANGWMLIHADNDLPAMTVPLPPAAGRHAVLIADKVLRGESVPRTFQTPKWDTPIGFSQNIKEYANPDFADEWWYTDMPCESDPFCS